MHDPSAMEHSSGCGMGPWGLQKNTIMSYMALCIFFLGLITTKMIIVQCTLANKLQFIKY